MCMAVNLPDRSNRLLYLISSSLVCPAQNDRACVLDLVFIKLTEIPQVHVTLIHIHYCNMTVQTDITLFFPLFLPLS